MAFSSYWSTTIETGQMARARVAVIATVLALVTVALANTAATSQGRAHFPVSGAGCELSRDGDGVVTTTFWELPNQTEVCVRLMPDSTPAKSVFVYLIALYAGREPTGEPMSILCRVQSSGVLGPTQIFESKVSLKADGVAVDLTGPNRKYELNYPCPLASEDCSFNGVTVLLQPSELATLSMAQQAGGAALGVPFTFTAAQLGIIRSFASRIGVAGGARGW
jgi:hypothetical protein